MTEQEPSPERLDNQFDWSYFAMESLRKQRECGAISEYEEKRNVERLEP